MRGCVGGVRVLRGAWMIAVLCLMNMGCEEADAAAVPDGAPSVRVRIEADDAAALAHKLEHDGYDILCGSVRDRSLEVVVRPVELDDLRAQGLAFEILEYGRPLIDKLRERGTIPAGYPDLAAVVNQMQAVASDHPDICQFVDLTSTYNQTATADGRHLYALKISDNVAQDEDEPAFLMVSTHHAREISTPVLALYAIDQLTDQYGVDPDITDVVNNNEIWIAPVWNPDGYDHVFTVDNLWRKNRQSYPGGIGVDTNRNYPQGWYNGCSGSTSVSSLTYKGPSPASEVETQTMMAFTEDRHFAKVIDYHSYGREALHGYACWNHPFDAYMQQQAVTMSTEAGYAGGHRSPSADGEHYEWQFGNHGAMAFLLEIDTEFQPAYSQALNEAAQVWPSALWMMQQPIPLWGYISDAATMQPVSASIRYDNIAFENDETNPSNPVNGRYHAFLPAGSYDVVVEADGYDRTQVQDVAITARSETRLDIQLNPPPDLTAPDGGEQLTAGVQTAITWTGLSSVQHQVQITGNYGDIAITSDGFESGAFDPAYAQGGDADWTIVSDLVHGGVNAARAGDITHNESSSISRTVSGGEVSFWYRVSSESNYDFFNFYINGVREVHVSGEVDWTQFATTLAPGSYELTWEYAKDVSLNSGSDTAWVDDVQIMVDSTAWQDVVALTNVGELAALWTPTDAGAAYKARVRAYYPAGYYGVWDESAGTFEVIQGLDCPGDTTDDGVVDVNDFFALLQNWGPCPPLPDACPWDFEPDGGDGDVSVLDFFGLLQHWGSCQE
jgi:carboxypeptidase T